MRISTSTITAVQKIITGDPIGNSPALAPYRTQHDIGTFFATVPGLDTEGVPGGSRWRFVEAVLRHVNGTDWVSTIIEMAVSPGHFLHTEFDVEDAVAYLNDFLVYDGVRLVAQGRRYLLVAADEVGQSQVVQAAQQLDSLAYNSIDAHVSKALGRIESQDFEGAITIARTMLESVLLELDQRLPGDVTDYRGELLRLYGGVRRKLRLDPNEQDVQSLQEILRGLTSIVSGLGTLRNRMGDAHPSNYRPHRHHAVLSLNAALTAILFLFETEQYQAALHSGEREGLQSESPASESDSRLN